MLFKMIKQKCICILGGSQSIWMARKQEDLMLELSLSDASSRFATRNSLHAYMHHYFHHMIPVRVREHREYFKVNNRGFGEDAFHSMWYLLLREYRPFNCLEIGVYRGQVISLWSLLSKILVFPCQVYGISPFSSVGDHVSSYLSGIDYEADILKNNLEFTLQQPKLLKAYSTDQTALDLIVSKSWDLIYIDGSHDYEVVLADYEICKENLASGGILVFDDSSLSTEFRPPLFSFPGHPGPSRVVKEKAMSELKFLGAVGHNTIFQKIEK